jgi:hypothetical protein
MPISWCGCLDGLGFVHVKLLQHVIGVLGLTYERAILELLDLKSKEKLQLSHHGHLEPIRHNSTKFLTKATLVLPNIMSSTYIWETKISLLTL